VSAANAPIVLIPGFLGFGDYWGTKRLRARFLPTTPGQLLGHHDRACEIFYQLVGGTVDYGEEHSRRHGHARLGRTYQPLHPAWGADRPIDLCGHSIGGMTARVLVHLLRQRAFPSHPNTSCAWVRSLTALSSPLNGDRVPYSLGAVPPECDYGAGSSSAAVGAVPPECDCGAGPSSAAVRGLRCSGDLARRCGDGTSHQSGTHSSSSSRGSSCGGAPHADNAVAEVSPVPIRPFTPGWLLTIAVHLFCFVDSRVLQAHFVDLQLDHWGLSWREGAPARRRLLRALLWRESIGQGLDNAAQEICPPHTAALNAKLRTGPWRASAGRAGAGSEAAGAASPGEGSPAEAEETAPYLCSFVACRLTLRRALRSERAPDAIVGFVRVLAVLGFAWATRRNAHRSPPAPPEEDGQDWAACPDPGENADRGHADGRCKECRPLGGVGGAALAPGAAAVSGGIARGCAQCCRAHDGLLCLSTQAHHVGEPARCLPPLREPPASAGVARWQTAAAALLLGGEGVRAARVDGKGEGSRLTALKTVADMAGTKAGGSGVEVRGGVAMTGSATTAEAPCDEAAFSEEWPLERGVWQVRELYGADHFAVASHPVLVSEEASGRFWDAYVRNLERIDRQGRGQYIYKYI